MVMEMYDVRGLFLVSIDYFHRIVFWGEVVIIFNLGKNNNKQSHLGMV